MYPTPAECASIRWDVVVIGTGMGGATAGYELARLGQRVLFVEKGPFLHSTYVAAPPGLKPAADRPAASTDAGLPTGEAADRLNEGRWPHRLRARTNLGALDFFIPIGCASGGSTAFYAAALERFAPADFSPRANFPAVHDSSLPDHWPISYQELEPHYEAAETLFRVRGTQDPLFAGGASKLLEPPALNARDRQLQRQLQVGGLHPYRLHVGCEFVPGCDGCPNGPCEKNCKRDAAWACLVPALVEHGAAILPDCEVLRIEAGADKVNAIVCRHGDDEWHLRARVIVLAAGAFATPSLLLRSRSAEWPSGLGNRTDLVGRNLMFHGGELIAVSPGSALDCDGAQKTLAVNDLYHADGEKLGTFQSLGVPLYLGQIMLYLRETAEYSTAWWKWLLSPRPVWWRKLTSPFVRLGATIYSRLFNFRDAALWVSIIEDLPYHQNRVYPDPDNPRDVIIEYRYSDELGGRVARFRERLRQVLGRRSFMVLSTGAKIDYPHVCGTCRFGDAPDTSVLDRNNRVHELENLYVVDASFLPSSGGTNPSLTIAANALRVAGVIDQSLQSGHVSDKAGTYTTAAASGSPQS